MKTGSSSKPCRNIMSQNPVFFFTWRFYCRHLFFGRIRINSDGELSPGPQVFPSKWPVILTTSRWVTLCDFEVLSPRPPSEKFDDLILYYLPEVWRPRALGWWRGIDFRVTGAQCSPYGLAQCTSKGGTTKNLLGGRSGDRETGSFFFGGGWVDKGSPRIS